MVVVVDVVATSSAGSRGLSGTTSAGFPAGAGDAFFDVAADAAGDAFFEVAADGAGDAFFDVAADAAGEAFFEADSFFFYNFNK